MLKNSKPEPQLSDGHGGILKPESLYRLMSNNPPKTGRLVRYKGMGYFVDSQGKVIDADYDWLRCVTLTLPTCYTLAL
jgi:hypothetical protein